MRNKVIVVLMVLILIVMAGCDNLSGGLLSSYAQSPEAAAKGYFDAILSRDNKAMCKYMGVNESTQFGVENIPDEAVAEVTFGNFKYVKWQGDDYDYEQAMRSVQEDWLNNNSMDLDFVYAKTDIKQIGYVSFVMTMKTSGETMSNWIPVVETDKGWFVVNIDMY